MIASSPSITPLDIESVNFKKVPMGYSVSEVDKFLEDIVKDYEKLFKENIELRDKLNMLNENVQYYKSLESTIQNTLVLAEKAADETKAAAHITAENITKDAELRALTLMNSYQSEINSLTKKIDFLKNRFEMTKIKVKQLLISELEMVLNNKIDDDDSDITLVIDKSLDDNK